MIKIFSKEQLRKVINYPEEVIDSIYEIIEILDDNYGQNRNIYNDLGGYVLVAENIVDIEIFKQEK